MKNFFKDKPLIISLGASFLGVLIVLVFISTSRRLSFFEVVTDLYQFTYPADHNNFPPYEIAHININYVFHIIILISLSMALLLYKLISFKKKDADFKKIFTLIVFTLFLILTSTQIVAQNRFLLLTLEILGSRSSEERTVWLHTDRYIFARECQRVFPGQHTAQLLTDMDLAQDPGMYYHRVLAYLLYPIDLRGVRKEPQDCLVVFDKNNPLDAVPADYKVIFLYDGRSLFAVKEKGQSL